MPRFPVSLAASLVLALTCASVSNSSPAMAAQVAGAARNRTAGRTTAPAVRIEGAWIREAPPTAEVMAAYFVLRNVGTRMDRLLSVETPISGLPTFHRTRLRGGMARMEPQDSIPVPPGATVRLRPGGDHLMLFELRRLPRRGEKVPMTFRFERSGAIRLEVPVQAADD